MYEALILDLKERLKRFPADEYNPDFCRIKGAYEALVAMNEALADLQAENAELREENGCLQHNVAAMQVTFDQQAKNCEVLLAEKDKEIKAYEIIMKTMPAQRDEAIYRMKAAEAALSRVEAERDAAKRCIYDIETYLTLGSAQYIGRVIQAWKSGAQGVE